MLSHPPAGFIGEFDAIDGPKMIVGSECFDTQNSFRRSYFFVHGRVLTSDHIATGYIQPDCQSFLSYIASRTLSLNTDTEDAVTFRESDNHPTVGGISFTLPDILARGESRRFCVAFMHTSSDALLSQWPLLRSTTEEFIMRWKQECAHRREREYTLITNLDQKREEAHKSHLRGFWDLIQPVEEELPYDESPHRNEKLNDIQKLSAIHSFFSVVLPLCLPSSITPSVSATTIGAQSTLPCNQPASLTICQWLAPFLAHHPSRGTAAQKRKVFQLFFCILRDIQVVVSGHNTTDCEQFVVSFSNTFSFAHQCCTNAAEYLPPSKCSMISFSSAYNERTAILPFDSSNLAGKPSVLDTRKEADGNSTVAHVFISKGRVADIVCFPSALLSATSFRGQDKREMHYAESTSHRLTAIVEASYGCNQNEALFQAQIERVISSHALKCRITSFQMNRTNRPVS